MDLQARIDELEADLKQIVYSRRDYARTLFDRLRVKGRSRPATDQNLVVTFKGLTSSQPLDLLTETQAFFKSLGFGQVGIALPIPKDCLKGMLRDESVLLRYED